MSECEVCGEVIRGKPILVSIGGAKMSVCSKCAKLGTPLEQPGSEIRNQSSGKIRTVPSSGRISTASRKRAKDVFDFMNEEIVEDFSERIRKARIEKGLSQKDLALELKEKEGLIKKIEKGLTPEDSVRKKLEDTLEIKLLDTMDSSEATGKKGNITPTLGDVMKIKKVK
ncbi:putative transcription factor [Methanomicrobium sp. W14]|uniref:multiprotein bridging factor aMBF1 n=1 Tax=Methanomicrobium sp. W14 TaxID=2817839 RepID=UPI001AEA29D7|nr:multiprotein bridging factor aMBF1 [Methanomicrobium sp. W14]MBP2133005.1 putative transcription factor [Methanomicrobium sp. W14]